MVLSAFNHHVAKTLQLWFSPLRCRSLAGSTHSGVDHYLGQSTQLQIHIWFKSFNHRSEVGSIHSAVDWYLTQSTWL